MSVAPVPTVLVVGDATERGRSFFKESWALIRGRYEEQAADARYGNPKDIEDYLEPVSYADYVAYVTNTLAAEEQVVKARRERSPLYPIALPVESSPDGLPFRLRLHKILEVFDVWGVVSCAPADTTRRLLKDLTFTGIPLLLAVDTSGSMLRAINDSASIGKQRLHSNCLRLIPGNLQQAATIITTVRMLLASQSNRVFLYAQGKPDPYVTDLVDAIRELGNQPESDLGLPRINRSQLADVPEGSVVVYIGYVDSLKPALERLRKSTLILSDGCREKEVHLVLAEESIKPRTHTVYFSHPIIQPHDYALDAYNACCRVWEEVLEEGFSATNCYGRLKGLSLRVLRVLEEMGNERYKFVGGENQRGGFLVKHLMG